MPAILIFTSVPDLRSARFLAKLLVEKRLAACVSFREGFTSVYRWKGKVENAREVLLFIKSSKKKFVKIKQLIRHVHPYEVPELIAVPITQGSSEYLSWLMRSIK